LDLFEHDVNPPNGTVNSENDDSPRKGDPPIFRQNPVDFMDLNHRNPLRNMKK
jgi:hypothetical protein